MDKDKKEKIRAIEEMIQVVLLRIPKEVEAMKFYLSAAKKATSEKARNLFQNLAEQEKGHEAELKRILLELKDELRKIKEK
ncbi:rubrerythrin [Deferribacter autotrophicus]|uniref:Rubrerythrin n=1 Tax=Deferribacter autotrophicus TaxID=500465 RepID=A0A5A8F470_9BACT|nr:ferritin family protein [Deferribacter autotrophicus]KAA0258836.1 rubrerythrin [Deferribacter autotrophicus]